METSRFHFPGFEIVRTEDTNTHEVEVGRITEGDEVFIVHMIRKSGLTFVGDFLVAKVFDATEKKCLWEFPKGSFDGLGLLALAGEEVVVALVGKGREGKVEKVATFSSMINHRPLDIRSSVKVKRLAAEFLGCKYDTSKIEQMVIVRDKERREAEEEAARIVAREARDKARQEVLARITGRPRVEVFTPEGRKRFGLPVVGDEWHVLANNTFVVLLESYDDDVQEPGIPVEAFKISKSKGGRISKDSASPVTWEKPSGIDGGVEQGAPEPVEEMVVEKDGDFFEVSVYADFKDIATARAAGLNSGVYVTSRDRKQEDGRYEIFSVQSEKIETVGLLIPMS